MRFHEMRNWILKQLSVKSIVLIWYVIMLMLELRKHSMVSAAELSGLNKAQFSKFLKFNQNTCFETLETLSKKQAKKLAPVLKKLCHLKWRIPILIDATLHKRSSLKTGNSQRFNHGQGFVVGHQWTNIILYINEFIIPLPPIPFYSKTYCRKHGIEYETEHVRIVNYLKALDLCEYIGEYCGKDVVILADSGYDSKGIARIIIEKGWDFVIALKSSRSVKSRAKYASTPKSKGWDSVFAFFWKNRKLAWKTVRVSTHGKKRKRIAFRVRHTIAFLKGVGKIQLVCSEFRNRPEGRRKYLACSNLRISPRKILIAYRIRWQIEIFHKQVKMHLGFEHIAATHFSSVESHVYLVYCAYILLDMKPPGMPDSAKTIIEKQRYIKSVIDNKSKAALLQLLTRIDGIKKFKDQLKKALSPLETCKL